MYFLLYTVSSIGVISLFWYGFLITKNLVYNLHLLKLIRENSLSLEELKALNSIGSDDIRSLIDNLTPNQQIYAGICFANIASMIMMIFATYINVYCIFLLVFYVCLLAFGGIIYNIRRHSRYEDEQELNVEKYFSILSVKERLLFGATIYSIVIVFLLCQI